MLRDFFFCASWFSAIRLFPAPHRFLFAPKRRDSAIRPILPLCVAAAAAAEGAEGRATLRGDA